MAVTSKPIHAHAAGYDDADDSPTAPIWQPLARAFWLIVAGVIWTIGLGMTYTIAEYLPMPLLLTGLLAVAIQAALSKIEAPIWNWRLRQMRDADNDPIFYARPRYYFFGPVIDVPALRPISKTEWAAQLIDSGINVGGVWLLVKFFHQLPPVVAVAEMFGTTPAPVTGWTALAWCCILGSFVAGAPELIRSQVIEE